MLLLAADENLNNDILRGLRRRLPTLDVIRVQDAGLAGANDEAVLAWCAVERRVLITHDVSTITYFAHARVAKGQSMPGVFELSPFLPIGQAIEDLILAECSTPGEWEGQIRYLPL